MLNDEVQLDREIKREAVASVYSGRDGKCCCGCSGKHSYTAAHREWASKHRGYPVTDADINEAQVTRVVKLINENRATARRTSDHASVVLGARLYIAYFREEISA